MTPIESAKNQFMKWLKKNKAIEIHNYEDHENWKYYSHVTAIVDHNVISVCFMEDQKVKIEYSFKNNRNLILSVELFLKLLK